MTVPVWQTARGASTRLMRWLLTPPSGSESLQSIPMPVLRRSPQETRVLLSDTSPYGSRVLEVEHDHVATAAYLRRKDGKTVAASWVANHREAPQHADLARLNAGQVPAMPSGRTRHPRGRPALDPKSLQVVWFEEGDGAALLEDGRPLCVIPGWSDIDRGVPGYSREAIGRSPFAFALDDEIEDLGPRIQQAQAFWDWRRVSGGVGRLPADRPGPSAGAPRAGRLLLARRGPPGAAGWLGFFRRYGWFRFFGALRRFGFVRFFGAYGRVWAYRWFGTVGRLGWSWRLGGPCAGPAARRRLGTPGTRRPRLQRAEHRRHELPADAHR